MSEIPVGKCWVARFLLLVIRLQKLPVIRKIVNADSLYFVHTFNLFIIVRRINLNYTELQNSVRNLRTLNRNMDCLKGAFSAGHVDKKNSSSHGI